MSFQVKIIKDSVSPAECRLTTFELTYPRFIHSELMTHRQFSRNAASSRAIPINKMIDRILEDTATPIYWGQNKPGMQAEEEVQEKASALHAWMCARDEMVIRARQLVSLGCHKQVVNRLLEPFAHMVTIVTATEWTNFFSQRCHKDAQPEFRYLACLMAEQYYEHSKPIQFRHCSWHTPYILPDEERRFAITERIQVSIARCARVSYVNQHGKRNIADDLDLYDKLTKGQHWSPFEHVAAAREDKSYSGNFCGWTQCRKTFKEECHRSFEWDVVKAELGWAPVLAP